jgi:hypothetical protein
MKEGTTVRKVRAVTVHWQQESALPSLRDPLALANLPAAERKAFTQLWADVAALLQTRRGAM